LPDPEVLHFMKQYLSKVARLGVRDGAAGKVATEAQANVGLWGKIRGELPDVWKTADDAFAKKQRLIDMMDAGRNVFRTQTNPAGNARKAVQTSLDAIPGRVKDAEQAEALRTGVGMAAQDRASQLGAPGKAQSPGRIFGSDTDVQRMKLGFKTPEEGDQFQRLVSAWDRVAKQKQRVLGNSATSGRNVEQAARAPDRATLGFFSNIIRGNFGRALGASGRGGDGDRSGAARRGGQGDCEHPHEPEDERHQRGAARVAVATAVRHARLEAPACGDGQRSRPEDDAGP
jgi:hypothetical protein